jgi:hypothetical protein
MAFIKLTLGFFFALVLLWVCCIALTWIIKLFVFLSPFILAAIILAALVRHYDKPRRKL